MSKSKSVQSLQIYEGTAQYIVNVHYFIDWQRFVQFTTENVEIGTVFAILRRNTRNMSLNTHFCGKAPEVVRGG